MYLQTCVISDIALARNVLNLKQAALLYDKILVLQTQYAEYDSVSRGHSIEALLGPSAEYLESNEIVSIVDLPTGKQLSASVPSYARLEKDATIALCNILLTPPDEAEPLLRSGSNAASRALSLVREQDESERSAPILFGSEYEISRLIPGLRNGPDSQERRTSKVLSIALDALPVPDELTPWESIIEFRNDPKNKMMFYEFCLWLESAFRSDRSPRELHLELVSKIDRYKRRLKKHQVNSTFAVLKAITVIPLTVLEKAAKFEWGEIAKALFSAYEAKAELFEEEEKLAENKARYLVHASRAFPEGT